MHNTQDNHIELSPNKRPNRKKDQTSKMTFASFKSFPSKERGNLNENKDPTSSHHSPQVMMKILIHFIE